MKFRTAWYREQQQQRELMSKPPARKRRRASAIEAWDQMETISVKLNQALQDLLETMRQPGGLPPEFSITLIADLTELPSEIKAPVRQKPVAPWGRHRIVAGGRIDEHAVIAKIEIIARAVIYGAPGEEPPAEMRRNTWYLPLESAEKQEKRSEKQQAVK